MILFKPTSNVFFTVSAPVPDGGTIRLKPSTLFCLWWNFSWNQCYIFSGSVLVNKKTDFFCLDVSRSRNKAKRSIGGRFLTKKRESSEPAPQLGLAGPVCHKKRSIVLGQSINPGECMGVPCSCTLLYAFSLCLELYIHINIRTRFWAGITGCPSYCVTLVHYVQRIARYPDMHELIDE